MQINKVSPVSYQAQIPKNLYEEMFSEANRKGHDCCSLFFTQTKNFKNWGHEEATSLALFQERTKEGLKKTLGLVSNYSAPLKRIVFPMKNSLLDSFLALTEKDVINAENSLLKTI